MAPKGTKVADIFFDIRAGLSNLQKDLGAGRKEIQKFSSFVETTFKVVGTYIGGRALLGGINLLNTSLRDLAQRGDKLSSVRDAFQALGGTSSALEKAKQATLGTVSAVDLMTAATTGLVRGVPKLAERFGEVSEFAKRFAEGTGRDTVEVLNELTTALGSGASKSLKGFGFALSENASKAENTAAAMAQLQSRISELPPALDSAADAQDALNVAFKDAFDQIGEGYNSNVQLAQSFRDVEKALKDLDFEQVGRDLASLVSSFTTLGATVLPTLTRELNYVAMGFEALTGSSARSQIHAIQDEIKGLEKELLNAESTASANKGNGLLGNWLGGDAESKAAEIKKQLDVLKDGEQKLISQAKEDSIKATEEQAKKEEQIKTALEKREAERRAIIEGDLAETRAKEAERNAEKESKLQEKLAEDMQRELEQAYKQSVDAWQSFFEAAIDGTAFDLEKALKSVASGFLAQMAQGIFGNMPGGLSNPADFGGMLAQQLGFGGGPGAGGLPGMSGGGGLFGGGYLSGLFQGAGGNIGPVANPSQYEGMLASGGLTDALGYAGAAYGIFNSFRGDKGWGSKGGSLAGAGIGGFFGGPVGAGIGANVGGMLGGKLDGMFGGKNADMEARRQVQKYLAEKFGKDISIGGSGAFNEGGSGWAGFDKLDSQSKQAFSAVGDQIKGILGITKDIGPQIGAILVDNIGGSAESLNNILGKLGLSVQDLEDSMIAMGKKGEKSWFEIEGAIESVEAVANKAKESVGAAVNEFVTSGGSGQQALDGIRDIAIAAQKEGAKTLEDLWKKLASGGLDAERIAEIQQAFAQRGITSLDSIINSSDRTAGAVVADVTAMGFQFEELTAQVQAAADAVNNFSAAASSITTGAVPSDVGGAVQAHASGGIISTPTFFKNSTGFHSMAEAGPEAIMPLTRVGGKLGVMAAGGGRANGGIVINVSAPGATPGMEQVITSAIARMQDGIIQKSVNATIDAQRRAGML